MVEHPQAIPLLQVLPGSTFQAPLTLQPPEVALHYPVEAQAPQSSACVYDTWSASGLKDSSSQQHRELGLYFMQQVIRPKLHKGTICRYLDLNIDACLELVFCSSRYGRPCFSDRTARKRDTTCWQIVFCAWNDKADLKRHACCDNLR